MLDIKTLLVMMVSTVIGLSCFVAPSFSHADSGMSVCDPSSPHTCE